MAQITLDLGAGGPALQKEDDGESGVHACVWVHLCGGATRRAGRPTDAPIC